MREHGMLRLFSKHSVRQLHLQVELNLLVQVRWQFLPIKQMPRWRIHQRNECMVDLSIHISIVYFSNDTGWLLFSSPQNHEGAWAQATSFQTASHIHVIHILCVWTPYTVVDGHMAAHSYRYHHRRIPRFGRVYWNPRWCKCGNDPSMLSLRL